jgi:hypothetical protein
VTVPAQRTYIIGPKQMAVHVAGESLALAVLVPLTLWVATRPRELSPLERAALVTGAIVSVVIDGALLYRNVRLMRETA